MKEIFMYECAMCGGFGKASYIHLITLETGVDTCPDCKGLGITLTDQRNIQSESITTKILYN